MFQRGLGLFTGLPFEEYKLDIRIATGAGTEILTKTIIAISPKHLDVNDDIHGWGTITVWTENQRPTACAPI